MSGPPLSLPVFELTTGSSFPRPLATAPTAPNHSSSPHPPGNTTFAAPVSQPSGVGGPEVLQEVHVCVPLTPFCLSSGDSGGVDFLATLRDEREDFSREVTLQRSNGVEFGMAFCDPTSNIILGSLIGP